VGKKSQFCGEFLEVCPSFAENSRRVFAKLSEISGPFVIINRQEGRLNAVPPGGSAMEIGVRAKTHH